MPRASKALTAARREEIVSACAALYETTPFKDITIKEIGEATSFTRTSIYNYFRTKEEIFLALLQREYELWNRQLEQLREDHAAMTRDEFADALAHSLEERRVLLKLLSMNHYDMEEHSRLERLTEFKRVYGRTLEEVKRCLAAFFPDMTEQARQAFLYSFFPFLFGIYPYTAVTEKQRQAMELARVDYAYPTIYELTCLEVKRLLGG